MYSKSHYDKLINNEMQRLNDQLRTPPVGGVLDEDSNDSFDRHNNVLATEISLSDKLRVWFREHQPTTTCTNALLQILIEEGLDVPSSASQFNESSLDQWSNGGNNDMNSWPNPGPNIRDVKRENGRDTNISTINDLQVQQRLMKAKLNLLMKEVARVNVRLDESMGITTAVNKSSNVFPIENVNELTAFENSLNDTNTGTFIMSMKRIVNNDTINKSLLRILSKNILLEHNLDGRQKKLALNAYPKLLDALFKAYGNYESMSEFTWDLKLAMKCIKNRFHKANCMKRKTKLNTSSSDPLMVNTKLLKKLKKNDCYF